MIASWREKFATMYCSSDIEKLKGYDWYCSNNEYSILFELLYDQPSQRREHIESLIKDAKPSWGYIYLVNLLRKKVFNTVFTTNFDDLLNEACYLFSNTVRPVVCAHDSSIKSIRISSSREKIIKLHGDFLFDNIKNTIRELESLEVNMKEKFRQYAVEFGLIVIGYNGSDRSVMETLDVLLRSDSYYSNGIYWCVRNDRNLHDNVVNLMRFPNFHLIQIDGFDEFFAEINSSLKLRLQPEMRDPYNALAEKLNSLIDSVRIDVNNPHPIIMRDIERLARKIDELKPMDRVLPENLVERRKEDYQELLQVIPFKLLAESYRLKGKINEALDYIKIQLINKPTMDSFVTGFDLLGKYEGDKSIIANDLMRRLHESKELIAEEPNSIFTIACDLMSVGEYKLADDALELSRAVAEASEKTIDSGIYIINKLLVKKFMGEDFNSNELEILNEMVGQKTGGALIREQYSLGALILLGRFEEAIPLIKKMPYAVVKGWPIFKIIQIGRASCRERV